MCLYNFYPKIGTVTRIKVIVLLRCIYDRSMIEFLALQSAQVKHFILHISDPLSPLKVCLH